MTVTVTDDQEISRGDTRDFTTTVTQGDEPFDLTGARLWFVGKLSVDDPDERAVFFLTTDPGGGIVVDVPESGIAIAKVLPGHTEGLKAKLTALECAWVMLDADGRRETIETFTLYVRATALKSTTSVSGGMPLAASYRAEWHVDSSAGRDDADGSNPSRALRTQARYLRLVGYEQRLARGQTVDFTLHGDVPVEDKISLRRIIDDPTSAFRIHGKASVLLEGNLTAYSGPSVPATNTQATVTIAGAGDAHIGKLLLFPAIDAEARIVDHLGGGVLQIDDVKVYGAGRTDIDPGTPSSNEPYQIVTNAIARFGALDLHAAWPGGFSAWPSPFLLENVRCPELVTFGGVGNFYSRTLVRRCELGDALVMPGASLYFRTCDFLLGGDSILGGSYEIPTMFSGCVFRGSVLDASCAAFGGGSLDSNVLACLFALCIQSGSQEGNLALLTKNGGPFSGLHLIDCDYVTTHANDRIYGTQVGDNALVLARGSRFRYQPGFELYAAGSGGRQLALGGYAGPTDLSPGLRAAAGGSLPALAPCTTWAELLAAPFNGVAIEPDDGCRITPDTI